MCTLITMPFSFFNYFSFSFQFSGTWKDQSTPDAIFTYFGIRSALEADECVLPAVNTVLAASLVARTSWVNRWTLPPSPGSRRRWLPQRRVPPISAASRAARHPVPQWRHGSQSFWTVLCFTFPLVCSFDSSSTKLLMWRMESVGSTFIIPDLLPVDNHWCINPNDDIPSYWEEFTTAVALIR